MPELADRRLVRHRLAAQINALKLPHGTRVVQCLFDRRIRQGEPLLETMPPQHAFDPDRRTPRAFAFRIDRLNRGASLRPRHHLVYVAEERLTSGGLTRVLDVISANVCYGMGRASRLGRPPSWHIINGE